MKIIFEDEKEKEAFLDTCRYLHDYTVNIDGVSKKTKIDVTAPFEKTERITPEKGSRWVGFCLDMDNDPMLNFLAHLPMSLIDVQNKYLVVENKNNSISFREHLNNRKSLKC